jgi:hypothetical protein
VFEIEVNIGSLVEVIVSYPESRDIVSNSAYFSDPTTSTAHQTLVWKPTLPCKTAGVLNFCGTRHGGNSLIGICTDVAARQKPGAYFYEP